MKYCNKLFVPQGLMIGTLIVGVLTINSAFAGEKVDRVLDTSTQPKLDIEHVSGDAEIRGWDKPQVKVTGELGDNTEEFIFEQRGNLVIVHVEVEKNEKKWWKHKENGDDLIIYVPNGSDVNYTAVNADVDISDITNSVNVDVVNGDVVMNHIGERIKVESVNGDITLNNVTGKLNIETVNGDIDASHEGLESVTFVAVNGDIEVETNSPSVNVETVNGGIDLNLQKIDSLDLTTVNGKIEANMYLNPNGRVKAGSVGGTMELLFQPNVSAQFDIEAHAGGDIINKITEDDVRKSKYGPSSWVRFINGEGDANVDLSTVNGRIVVKDN